MPKTFSDLLAAIKSSRFLHMIFAPNLDSILASSFILRLLKDSDIDVALAPSYTIQKPLETRGLILLVGVTQRTVVPGYRVLHIDDYIGRDPRSRLSISLYVLKHLKDIWIIPRDLEVLALSAMLSLTRSSIYDEDLVEAHRPLLDETLSKGIFEFIESLRLFGYPHRDLRSALEETVDPYILGVSLDRTGSAKLIEKLGIDLVAPSEESKQRLAQEVLSIVSSYAKRRIDILGSKLVLRYTDLASDVYELTYRLYTALDLRGPEILLALGLEPSLSMVFASFFNSMRSVIKEFVESVLSGEIIAKRIVLKGLRVSLIDIDTSRGIPPLFTVYRILKALEIVEDLTVFRKGSEIYVPLPLLEPRWPPQTELHVEKGYAIFGSLEEFSRLL